MDVLVCFVYHPPRKDHVLSLHGVLGYTQAPVTCPSLIYALICVQFGDLLTKIIDHLCSLHGVLCCTHALVTCTSLIYALICVQFGDLLTKIISVVCVACWAINMPKFMKKGMSITGKNEQTWAVWMKGVYACA